MTDVEHTTDLLLRIGAGSPEAVDQLFPLVYDQLQVMARDLLRRERADHTLRTTDLLHEAYLRMVNQTRCAWQSRAHFMAVASRAMRRILVDHARRRGRKRHGGGWSRTALPTEFLIGAPETDDLILSVHEALDRLEERHPEKARLVEMRFFAGLTHDECASVLGISPRTAARHWEYAQAWLYRHITESHESA